MSYGMMICLLLEAPKTKVCHYCKSEIAIDATRCPHCTSELP